MPRRRSWLCLIRSIFFLETNHHKQHHKRSNKKRWLFGRLRKNKGRFSTIEPPPPQPCQSSSDKPKIETEEKQSTTEKDTSDLVTQCEIEYKSFESNVPYESQSLALNHHHENLDDGLAAIRLQTFYRGYLARKALRALKGFVRLQAIIRGRAVRRQTITTLKCLEAIVNIQFEVCTRSELIQHHCDNTCFHHNHQRDDRSKVELHRRTRLDDGLLTKDNEIGIMLKKKEAMLRRQRSKTYSFNHRHSTDSEDGNVQGRLKYWLEQYVEDEALKNCEKRDPKQPKLRNIKNLNNHQTIFVPRRSFHKLGKQNCYIDDGLVPCSATSVPTYMAATESTKAKTRSTSSPRLRPRHFEAYYSDGDSPYKYKFISPMSSINSDMTCLSKISSKSFCPLQQKSPSFKGIPSPLMSNRNLRDVHTDSLGLLVNKCSR